MEICSCSVFFMFLENIAWNDLKAFQFSGVFVRESIFTVSAKIPGKPGKSMST